MDHILGCFIRTFIALHVIWFSSLLGKCTFDPHTDVFDSLAKVEEYASSTDEHPEVGTIDWENPDYSSFHKSMLPAVSRRWFTTLGIIHQLWSPVAFKQLLEAIINMREYSGYTGRFVQKIAPRPATQIIILGDLHGAFHSLVRDLRTLKDQGIIDEHFKIIKPDHFIVFNGNIVSRSAYILETLTLIMRLMFVNPNSIIYVRGEQEDRQYWLHYGLRRELMVRASSYQDGDVPLNSLVDRFFNTLPLVLYLIANESQKVVDLLRISGYGSDKEELKEKNFADFFKEKEQFVWHITGEIKRQPSIALNVRAIIRGEQFFRSHYLPTQGLELLGKEEGATAWIILSCPTLSYQKLFNFFYDAFVILTTYKSLDDWILALYNQDIRANHKLSLDKVVRLISGIKLGRKDISEILVKAKKEQAEFFKKEVAKKKEKLNAVKTVEFKNGLAHVKEITLLPRPIGVVLPEKPVVPEPLVPKVPIPTVLAPPAGEILFGSAMDLTRGVRDLCLQVRAGIELVFNDQNKKGGIGGEKLAFLALDDEYTPSKTPATIRTLLEIHKTDKLLNPVGTPTLDTYIKLVEQGKVLVLFPITGSPTFRLPKYKYIIHYRSSYPREGEALARYACETLKAKKVVLFYQSDVPSIDGVVKYFKEIGFKNYIKVIYERGIVKMDKQVATITKENPDTIIFLAIPTAATELIRQLGVQNVAGKNLLGWSDLAGELFQKFVRQKGIEFVISNVVPSPLQSQLPLVKEFRKEADQNNILKDTFALEGFISARIVVAILKQIKGPITKEKIVEVAEGLRDFDLGGLCLTFNPQTRELCPTIWMDTGVGEWNPITFEVPKVPKVVAKPVEEGIFTIASNLDLSRGIKVMGDEIKRATEVVFEDANITQKIPGTSLRLLAFDDEYEPDRARANIEQLIDQKASTILLSALGSQTFNAYKDIIETGKLLALFPIPGVPGKRSPDFKYCIYFRPSYIEEATVLAHYALKHLQTRKVAIFYQNDLFGKACFDGAKKVFDDAKISYVELPYERNDVNFDGQVEKIKNENPDLICLFSVPTAAKTLLQGLGDRLILDKQFLGVSDLGLGVFRKFAQKKGLKRVISNVLPDPEVSMLPIIQEYRKTMKKNGIPIDSFSLEGYINAAILVDLLSRMKQSFSKENIIAALEAMKDYNLGGLKLTFDRETRQLSNTIWLDTSSGDWKPTTKGKISGGK